MYLYGTEETKWQYICALVSEFSDVLIVSVIVFVYFIDIQILV